MISTGNMIKYIKTNNNGAYLGCMECTQDVEEIRHLEGEKRLL
jgi:DUF438 domain-containing protein